MAMNFIDTTTVEPLRNARLTPEGYLAAEAFAVRTGIQLYRGSEVGMNDRDVVRVYRPEEEVFDKRSVSTFVHKPVTVDHPRGGVTADTWREHAVGEVSTEAMRDGERLKFQLVVKDSAAVKMVQDGTRRQLSAGYSCQLDPTPGVTPDGQAYDAVQRNITVNHLALVERGRAGNCQIGDSDWGVVPLEDATGAPPRNPKEVHVDTKPVVLGDKAVHVVAADASTVEAFLASMNKQITDTKALVDAKDGEIVVLKKQLADAEMTPAKLQKLVADRAVVTGGYRKLTGKEADGNLSDAEIRKEAVLAKLGDAAKGMSDAAIEGAFTALTADTAPANQTREAIAQNGIGDAHMGNLADVFKLAGVPMKKKE